MLDYGISAHFYISSSIYQTSFEINSFFMKEKEDYISDIAEMRSMMERSTRFMSLSAMGVILVGVYALAGVFIAYQVIGFDPRETISPDMTNRLLGFGGMLMMISIITVLLLSYKKASGNHEKFWNPTFQRLFIHALIPLLTGGILILILVAKDLPLFIIPFSLVFYGLMLYTAGKFTYPAFQRVGLLDIALGLFCTYFTGYSLGSWAIGFGLLHIALGLYLYFRYER